MKTFPRLALLLCMAFASTMAHAQLLTISVSDTTGLSNGMILAPGGDFQPLTFVNNKLSYDRDKLKPFTTVSILSPSGFMFSAVVEPGQTLQMKLSKKGDLWKADYKGKNRDACVFQNEFGRMSARGWENIEFDEYGEEVLTFKKSFDFDTESARVDKQYALCKKLAAKIQPVELSQEYLKKVEATLLSSRFAMANAREQMAGRDPMKSASVQAILKQVNPNSEDENERGLTVPFLKSKLSTTKEDLDQTAYGIEFAQTIDKYVSNEKIRHILFNELASSMFNTDGSKHTLDIDKFWSVYTKLADQELITYYQDAIDSHHATTSGAICPDESFVDLQGNKHLLSEFFNKGKYLFIDIWATWCIPCCAEIPFVEKHVQHYKDNDKIQFISISIDHNHEAWKKKLKKDNPQWQQFISSNKEEINKLMKDWGIMGIPRFVIISPDGTINQASAFRPSDDKFYELLDAIIH
jgi:redoxin family